MYLPTLLNLFGYVRGQDCPNRPKKIQPSKYRSNLLLGVTHFYQRGNVMKPIRPCHVIRKIKGP